MRSRFPLLECHGKEMVFTVDSRVHPGIFLRWCDLGTTFTRGAPVSVCRLMP